MIQIAMIEDEEHTRKEVAELISREFEKIAGAGCNHGNI